LHGDLLLDATGSKMNPTADGRGLAEGSVLSFHEGIGRDGGRALFAFTRQDEANRMHSEASAVTVGQPSTGLLEFAVREEYAWLQIDPGGPTCALGLDDMRTALRSPRNERVKAAVAIADPRQQRSAVLEALAHGGLLLQAVGVNDDGGTMVRTTTGSDAKMKLLTFTSEMEIAARYTNFNFIVNTIERTLHDADAGRMAGLLINPAGPSLQLDLKDIRSVGKRLKRLR
jgi:hypothetical protein